MVNKKSLRKFYCPVPNDQRPLNEYLNLKNSFIFNWPTFNFKKYFYNLLIFSFFLFIFLIPITNFYYSFFEFPLKFFLVTIKNIFILEILFLLRIYLGWLYIKERLEKSIIEYEESGWFDGQIWVKPIKILKQDRLISYYKVVPVLIRLKKNIIYFIVISILIFLLILVI
jgi:hypothetical protein